MYSVEDRILIWNLYKFENYNAKTFTREFLGKGWTVSGLNKLNWKLRSTGSTRRRQGSGRPHSARMMTTFILSMNWFWVRKVGLHQRVTEPHVKFHERQEFTTLRYIVSLVRIWSWSARRSVVRKNSLLQTVRCTELAHENSYVVSQHQRRCQKNGVGGAKL